MKSDPILARVASYRRSPGSCALVRATRLAALVAILTAAAWVGACHDDRLAGPEFPDSTARPDSTLPPTFVVSNSVAITGAVTTASRQAAPARSAGAAEEVVYVSLRPGTLPNGGLATVRNTRTGGEVSAAMAAGGFDPVPVGARVGDTLAVTVLLAGGGDSVLLLAVPMARRPIVVRTDPPPRKRDVPLNARMVIVFSEPIRASTAGSIRLLRAGAPVSGRVVTSGDGLRAELQPDAPLALNTDYALSIPTDVTDLSGDPLEQSVLVEFTTGSSMVVASVATDQAALFINPISGDLRTFSFTAILDDEGRFSGTFSIYYPGTGARLFGRVTCFAIADGNAAWVAGVAEGAGNPALVGVEWGWRVVDHGPAEGGVPDELSLAWPLADEGLGSAQEFCASTPTTSPVDGEIRLFNLLSGNIVVNGSGPPPPPPPGGMSQIAFHAAPLSAGGIRVMNADGSNARTLTGEPGDGSPAWSPDGTKLAIQRRDSAGAFDIYVMNYDGSGVVQLTSGSTYDSDPAWSPDGSKIAFHRDGALYVVNADGSGVTMIIQGGWRSHPTWSPDGSKIAFGGCGQYPSYNICVINADGSGLTPLTNDSASDYRPAWSPDGTRIAFARAFDQYGNSGLHVMNADGSGITRVTLGINGPPSWSPDSRMIVYEWYGMKIVNADGSGLTALGGGFTPAWSPVGTMPPRPDPYLSVRMVGGDAQTDTVRATLAEALRVLVHRDDGTPVSGVTVSWAARAPGPTYSPPLSTNRTVTDASGIASVTLTFGPIAGRWTVEAAVTDGTARSAFPVTFTATARPGRPVLFERYIGDYQVGTVGSALGESYSVYAFDGHGFQNSGCPGTWCGNAVSGVPVSWAVTSGGGTITPLEDTTAITPLSTRPLSRAVHTLGPNEGTNTVTATAPTIAGIPQVTFTARVVTAIVEVNFGFYPDSVVVPSGRTVAWLWAHTDDSDNVHNITFEDDPSYPNSSPNMGSGEGGEVFTRTFTGGPRTIRYRCTLHTTDFAQGEVGVVIVQ